MSPYGMWVPGPCPEKFQVGLWSLCWMESGSPAPVGDLEARHALPNFVNTSSRLWGGCSASWPCVLA